MRSTVLALLLMVFPSIAQQDQSHTDSNPSVENMPFHVSLFRDLSSAKAKVGDPVELKQYGEVKDRSGKVIIGKDARLYGRVTDVARYDKRQSEARLAIIADRVESGGKSIPINAAFCGSFYRTPEVFLGTPGRTTSITPRNSGLPGDTELRPASDPRIGAALVSKKEDIVIASEAMFWLCQQRAVAYDAEVDARPVVAPASLPAGVEFTVTLKTALDAATAKVGDPVVMAMTSNLLGPGNTIAIPKRATISGRIVIAESAKSGPSRLAVVAERATWDGGSVPLNAFISDKPTLSNEAFPEMLGRGRIVSVDLQQITVEVLPNGGTGLRRDKKTIQLPPGSILSLRQTQ